MASTDTRIYVNKETFQNEISTLGSKLDILKQLLDEYEAKKEEARRVWGDEDENQKKAIELCESAIKVVKKKIAETENSKGALENVSSDAYAIQEDIGNQLDDARRQVESLLN
jgi:predicted RNase H-like nuclease (RuvC/YqgF family)